MPANHGVGLDDHQGAAPVSPRVGEPDPKQSVSGAKERTFTGAHQSGQLLTQGEVLKDDGLCPRPISISAHNSVLVATIDVGAEDGIAY
jgi:hypothetical protein